MIGTLEKRSEQKVERLPDTKRPPVDFNVLVSRAQKGQAEAFAKLYEEYLDPVYRYVYLRTGQTEQAEDITQGVFLRAFESITDYRQMGKPFLGWLMRIAHNLVVDYYRWGKRHPAVPLPESILMSSRDPVVAAEQNCELDEVKKAIMKLSAGQSEVFSLRFIAGLSVSETAEVTGKSVGAVKTLQHEAVVKLRKMIREV